MISCLGLEHEPEGANFVCRPFPELFPEDGNWDEWCAECERGEADATDRAIDRAMEMMGAWE